jgi:hypothetical protein
MPIDSAISSSTSTVIGQTIDRVDRASGSGITKKRELNLSHQPPLAFSEEEVQNSDDKSCVYILRGVTPTQRKYLSTETIKGSYVSLINMHPDEFKSEATSERPSEKEAEAYVNQCRTSLADGLIEFTTSDLVATVFSQEARFSYVLTIEIQKELLRKGSFGESGWIAKQSAPYSIVGVTEYDSISKNRTTISNQEFDAVVQKERNMEMVMRFDMNKPTHPNDHKSTMRILEQKKLMKLDLKEELSLLRNEAPPLKVRV